MLATADHPLLAWADGLDVVFRMVLYIALPFQGCAQPERSGRTMSWWIIGLGLWFSPALVIGTGLLIVARRPSSTRTQEGLGFWWDAQGKVWNPADVNVAAQLLAAEAVELVEDEVHWPTLEIAPHEAPTGRIPPLLPGPTAPAPAGP
jgi:hypothetical protein